MIRQKTNPGGAGTATGEYDIVREGKRNQKLDLLNTLTYTAAGGMLAGSYLQAFMLSKGMTAGDYSVMSFVSTAMSMLAYLLFAFYRPRSGSYFPTLRLCALLAILYPLSLLLCTGLPGGTALWVMIIASGANSLIAAFKATAAYAVTPHLYPRSEYGALLAKGGLIGCLVAAVISLVGPGMLGDGTDAGGYALFFGLSAAGLSASAGLIMMYRPLRQQAGGAQEAAGGSGLNWSGMIARLRDRAFAFRMLPHLIRGVGAAAFGYFSLVGITNTPLTAAQSSYLVTIGVVAQLAGNYLLLRMSRRISSGLITLMGMGVQAVCLLVISFVHDNVVWLFALLFISSLAGIIGDSGVPMGVVKSTPTEDLALVSSLRMLACSGTNCLFVLILGRMIGSMTFLALLIGAAAFTAAGILYYRQFTDELSD